MISSKLQNTHWPNVTRSSCNGVGGLNKTIAYGIYSNVTCDCSFNNNTACHVIIIDLKRLNLTGFLPSELANLSYLRVLSLLANRVNGSIPQELGDIATLEQLILEDNQLGGHLHQNLGGLNSLRRLRIDGSKLSGKIPDFIGNWTSIKRLILEDNQLGGPLPENLGNLSSLRRLLLSANDFNGTIPETFTNLKNLTDFRIDGSRFSGKIPDFIGNWTSIERLDMQGTSMEGPIPSTISQLKNLKELILRNCLMIGSIPEYIGQMTQLYLLDLSFNRLTGGIPDRFQSLSFIDYFDLSYNNFTQSSGSSCSSSNHSLFINCGGGRTKFEGNEYEADTDTNGPSYFFASSEKWAYSSTGLFMGNDRADYITGNKSNVAGADLYRTARLAPTSLKYYGLCLRNGSYRVRLHFAEIMYSDDMTFSSLGRRIFDVSIQGNVVLKDFNIVEAAKGVNKGITMDFNDILVTGSTLEIHFYWAGKGTTAVPNRGVYGPLISAIKVTPNFDVDTGGLSVGAIVGIVAASCVAIILILIALRMNGYLGGKNIEDKELRELELQTGYFTLRQIKVATNNFDPANKIGEGGFGPVYKGVLPDGAVIAVKQLSAKSKQGNREFVNEIGMISALQHPNLVKLYGCCIEGNQLLLVYEYLENNSLARALFGRQEQRLNLEWPTRKKICLGIARGLAYLHEESRLKIVHRDIKATNVLLDKDLNAKISDFGLAKLDEEENTHISTRIAGTM
ncbi:hypothetical protein RJ639_014525 [Escallonia herrerae]|uniref:non-specific serine/threonine protein kinase n=1 Tax=Escallonia herrerae TaxID=1293975 RepID=A0AA88VH02_9ASTE|nr:hypothetical protein RJ639_014525 [Escallonia herrerae]